MGGIGEILAGFGLSAATGLNAYIPLLMVGLAARFTGWIKLGPPYDMLANEWVLVVLGVLLVIEFFADKIAVVDHINDVIQTFIRPAAGALLFAANTNIISDVHPALALALGLVVSFGVHATKATARPVVTATTFGVGNPVVSLLEDIVSFFLTLLAILSPFLLLLLFALLLYVGYRIWNRRTQRAPARVVTPPPVKWPR